MLIRAVVDTYQEVILFHVDSLNNDRTFTMATRPFPTAGGNTGVDTFYDSSMAWTHTVSTTVFNDVRFGFLRGELLRLTPSTNVESLQIPNLVQQAVPTISMAGYQTIGDSARFDPTQTQYQVTDNVSMVKGKHVLGFGADFRRFNINDLQLTATQYPFNTLQHQTARTPTPARRLRVCCWDFPARTPPIRTRGRFYQRSNYFAVYAQDTYKVSHNFTANLGLRYDVEQNPNELDWNGSNFDLASGQMITMRQLGTNRVQHTQWKNFGPRVGFAWSPFGGRTIVRASYGIFYAPITGRATSAFDRFPKDQLFTLQTSGYAAPFVLSATPPVVATTNGYNLSHYHDNPNAHVPYVLGQQHLRNVQSDDAAEPERNAYAVERAQYQSLVQHGCLLCAGGLALWQQPQDAQYSRASVV